MQLHLSGDLVLGQQTKRFGPQAGPMGRQTDIATAKDFAPVKPRLYTIGYLLLITVIVVGAATVFAKAADKEGGVRTWQPQAVTQDGARS